jgi:hypothetical protein
MKKATLVLSLVALSAFGLSQEKSSVSLAPKKDSTAKYKLEIAMSLGGMDVSVKSEITNKVTKVEESKYGTETSWSNLKISLNGTDMDGITAEPVVAKFDLKGDLLELSGGVQGTDPVQMHLLSVFVPPPSALAKDEKATIEFAGNADKTIPARKYEVTSLGKETVSGKETQKFQLKLTPKEEGGLTIDATYWVLPDGTLVKGEGKFTNLFIPQAGSGADGTFKFESI